MVKAVVGIFQSSDAVSTLAHTLKARGLDLAPLTIISRDEPTGYLATIGARFVRALEPVRMGGEVDVEVPGERAPQLGYYEVAESSPAAGALSDLSVPDGRSDDFLTAVDAGRCVAGYPAGDRVDEVKALFAQTGANPIAIF